MERTVLIVEDDPQQLDYFRILLKSEGFIILTAESPIEALAVLEEEPVDCIVSDVNMPQMSVEEFLNQLCSRFPEVPRVMMTSSEESIAHELLSQGAHHFCPKMRAHEMLNHQVEHAMR